MEELVQEQSDNILYLTDESGEETKFEYLDSVDYQGDTYIILLPVDEPETRIVILKVEPVDEEYENYLPVNDLDLLNAVYDIFKERYKDILTFEE